MGGMPLKAVSHTSAIPKDGYCLKVSFLWRQMILSAAGRRLVVHSASLFCCQHRTYWGCRDTAAARKDPLSWVQLWCILIIFHVFSTSVFMSWKSFLASFQSRSLRRVVPRQALDTGPLQLRGLHRDFKKGFEVWMGRLKLHDEPKSSAGGIGRSMPIKKSWWGKSSSVSFSPFWRNCTHPPLKSYIKQNF